MKTLFKMFLLLLVSFSFAASSANAQYVVRTKKDTAAGAVTHYITVPSTADGITGIEANVTKVSGTVAGTLTLQGRIDSLLGWTNISATTFTTTDVASQKFIWPIAVHSFNGFRVAYTTTGTQSSAFQVAYLRRNR